MQEKISVRVFHRALRNAVHLINDDFASMSKIADFS